jgi:hypothetical protein
LNRILVFISVFSSILPFIAGLRVLKKIDRNFDLIIFLFGVVFVLELSSTAMALTGLNNIWIGNSFRLIELFTYTYVFSAWIGTRAIQLQRNVLSALFLVFFLYTTIFVFKSIFVFNTYAHAVEALILVYFAGLLLFHTSGHTQLDLFRDPRFWFGSAVLFFFSVNLLVFGMAQYILQIDTTEFRQIWVIHSVSNVFFNLLCTVGFLCSWRARTL